MKLYGGIDLHSNNSVINLIDENSQALLRKRMANSLDTIVMLLEPYRDDLVGLVLSQPTTGTGWLTA